MPGEPIRPPNVVPGGLRGDDAAHLRYTLLVNVARAGWLTSFTALILTPIVIRRVRRNRRDRAAARAASPQPT